MICKNNTFKLKITEPVVLELFPENALAVDIETTGFSPRSSKIYLIGAAFRRGNTVYISQYLSEKAVEEKELLQAFVKQAAGFTRLITFNGDTFDLPFLKLRCDISGIDFQPDTFETFDIFRSLGSLKHLLRLNSYRQKSLEFFLGLDREDMYNGGELICIYKKFEQHPDPEAEKLLLTHNYEDVEGMLSLLSLFAYHRVAESTPSYEAASLSACTGAEGMQSFYLILSLTSDTAVPKKLSVYKEGIELVLDANSICLHIPVQRGNLRYYYPNYRDYVYLLTENKIIHKSIGNYVDKEYRRKCTREECFVEKEGIFLPQFHDWKAPAFCLSPKDEMTFFEFKREMLADSAFLAEYGAMLIKEIMQ